MKTLFILLPVILLFTFCVSCTSHAAVDNADGTASSSKQGSTPAAGQPDGVTGQPEGSAGPAVDPAGVPPVDTVGTPAGVSPDDSASQKPLFQAPEVIMDFDDSKTALEIARDMGAGWNLGNTLDAGGDSPMPITALAQETSWGNPVTTEEMMILLADSGFSSFRVPVTWQRHIGPAPDYRIEPEFMDRVQEVVDYGINNGLYVILNMHHETWHFPSADNSEAAPKLIAVWQQIAVRFAGYSEKLLFESMNEPRMTGTGKEWTGGTPEARSVINSWNYIFINTVRETGYNNTNRFLLIPTIAASGDAPALSDFYVPKDPNVLVSIHAYTPYDIVLSTSNPRNTFDPTNARDVADVDALFKRLDDRFVSKGVPVVIGEMGCLNKSDNTEQRVAWVEYYTGLAAQRGIPCLWWDNGIRSATGNAESFGIMDRMNATWWYPEIAAAMVSNYK